MNQEGHPAACRCGHDWEAHAHYRRGSECALCTCPRWRPPFRWRGLLARWDRAG